MFILRRIIKSESEVIQQSGSTTFTIKEFNYILGEEYKLIKHSTNVDDFLKLCEKFKWNESEDNKIYGAVTNLDESKVFPLYEKDDNFIMFTNGKTFAKL